MTKTFQLIFSQITTNNKNIYNVIYDNLHKADATVFVFVDTDKSTLDFYCEAFKHFYDEPNIYFIGIEKDLNNITPNQIKITNYDDYMIVIWRDEYGYKEKLKIVYDEDFKRPDLVISNQQFSYSNKLYQLLVIDQPRF